MNKIIIVISIIGGLFGYWIVGGIEDYATAQLLNISQQTNCDNITSEEWTEICDDTQKTTKSAITIFNLLGFFGGFGIVASGLKKSGL
ncbi:MAG: hypothetical protein IIA83_04570 [Thaumarchaeota archaeon]|nr:hypothetical protein [Nitrososphaerota archaeon]